MMGAKPFARATSINKQKGQCLGLYCLYLCFTPEGEILFSTGGAELYSLSKDDLGTHLADDLLSTIYCSIAAEHKQYLPATRDLFQKHKDLLSNKGDLLYNTKVAEHTMFL